MPPRSRSISCPRFSQICARVRQLPAAIVAPRVADQLLSIHGGKDATTVAIPAFPPRHPALHPFRASQGGQNSAKGSRKALKRVLSGQLRWEARQPELGRTHAKRSAAPARGTPAHNSRFHGSLCAPYRAGTRLLERTKSMKCRSACARWWLRPHSARAWSSGESPQWRARERMPPLVCQRSPQADHPQRRIDAQIVEGRGAGFWWLAPRRYPPPCSAGWPIV